MCMNIVWSNCHVAAAGCGEHVVVVALLVYGAYIWMSVQYFILKRVEFENLRSQFDKKIECIF